MNDFDSTGGDVMDLPATASGKRAQAYAQRHTGTQILVRRKSRQTASSRMDQNRATRREGSERQKKKVATEGAGERA